MTFRSRVFETRVSTSSTTPARRDFGAGRVCLFRHLGVDKLHAASFRPQAIDEACSLWLEAHYDDLPLSRKGLMSSMGIGKMIVEFFSVAISASVCR